MTTALKLRTLGDLVLSGPDGEELLRRRITLALLTVLADRAPQSVKREELQALFWGERAEDRARHSLRQVVHGLRRLCGNAIEIQPTTIRLVDGSVEFDARLFAEAASARRWCDALGLWNGQFLPECESIGIDEFRIWLEVERERLRLLLRHCFEQAVSDELAAGKQMANLPLYCAWVRHFPYDEAPHRAYIEALCRLNRIAEAVSARGAFVQRLERETEQSPSAEWLSETEHLVAVARDAEVMDLTLRAQLPDAPAIIDADAPGNVPSSMQPSIYPAGPASRKGMKSLGRSRGVLVVGGLALCAAIGIGVGVTSARPHSPPVLAIGAINSGLPSDSVRGFATLLTIDLARIVQLNVVSERRISEVAASHRYHGIEAVARAAGARELIDGLLSVRPDRTLRADLRRTDLVTGQTRAAYSVEAKDLTELADLITERIARDLGTTAPSARKDATTNSLVAYRFYERGLREFYDDDGLAARRSFTEALAEDSTFAMAALYDALGPGSDGTEDRFARSMRLAQHASDRERLLISAMWARHMRDARAVAWADTLVARYPMETEGHLILALELDAKRDLWASLRHFRHVVDMDSSSRGVGPFCRACQGLSGMATVFFELDSLSAAERVARTWVSWQPHSPAAWLQLERAFGEQRRYAEAHRAADSVTKYSPDPTAAFAHTVWWFRSGDFASIDGMWRDLARSPKPEVRLDALWTGVISLRTQGRMGEAIGIARQFRRESAARGKGDAIDMGPALLEAVTRMDAGQSRYAAALFDSMAARPPSTVPSRVGAHRAMNWTFAASAYALAHDEQRLATLEDSVRVNGLLATDRYHTLHHFVRGLRLAAVGKYTEAADAYRLALRDPQGTYVRVYLELARALLAANRPAEAVQPLTVALAGPTSAAGLYATRTELQELLGVAYERAQQPDSAVAQYQRAARAWTRADPAFAVRRDAMEHRIAALTR